MVTEEEYETRMAELTKQRLVLEDYLALVVARRDWHGVMDAAADLRETEAEISALKWFRA